MNQTTPPAYRITIAFSPGRVPTIIRLRRFLKMAWRGYGLKAVKVEELADDGQARSVNTEGAGEVLGGTRSRPEGSGSLETVQEKSPAGKPTRPCGAPNGYILHKFSGNGDSLKF